MMNQTVIDFLNGKSKLKVSGQYKKWYHYDLRYINVFYRKYKCSEKPLYFFSTQVYSLKLDPTEFNDRMSIEMKTLKGDSLLET